MPSKRRVLMVVLGALCVPLLGESCWDPILNLRACAVVVMHLDLAVGEAFIPNCSGSGRIQSIRGRETIEYLPSLPASLTPEIVQRSRFADEIKLRATPGAALGTTDSFTLSFVPTSDVEDFRQQVLVEVTFGPDEPSDDCSDGPLEPIPAASACDRIAHSAAAHFATCFPDLSAAETLAMGQAVCLGGDRFDGPNVTYDSAEAAACACAIEEMDCAAGDPFRFIPACANAANGNLADGALCDPANPFACSSGVCHAEPFVCGGACLSIVPVDGTTPCIDQTTGVSLPCEAGAICGLDQLCEVLPGVGEECNTFGLCAGDVDPFVVTGPICGGTGTCAAPGGLGEVCAAGGVGCNGIYACDGFSCIAKPGPGEACDLPSDGSSVGGWFSIVIEGRASCTVSPLASPAGDYCIPADLATESGQCAPAAAAGEPCGLDDGLSPFCEPGSWCDGIDPDGMTTGQVGTCVAWQGQDGPCNVGWLVDDLGPQCEPGFSCQFDFAGDFCTCD